MSCQTCSTQNNYNLMVELDAAKKNAAMYEAKSKDETEDMQVRHYSQLKHLLLLTEVECIESTLSKRGCL